ncbi:hypothetical protein [Companilactobacillus zhongbaensis]|uniref:hypothetical protein n=1 Tax=Companilactobacillus zhongbaensis TaxID=2486009 RepID=UPI000F7A3106|nr:hypothetical protein [Companilactobacillus zhongbaensis]
MINKFQKVISWIILICVAIYTSIVFIQMWQNYFGHYLQVDAFKNVVFLVIALLLTIGIGYFLMRISTDDARLNAMILITLLALFAVMAIFWINSLPPEQVSDFHKFWFTAPDALNGKSIYAYDNDYFAKWSYQSGFLVYVMAVIKIFGYHIAAIQYLNVIYQVVILLLTYKLVVKIFDNVKMARLSVFSLMINLDWFALNSQADNQYLGTMFFLLTFYLILLDKYWTYLLAGITLTLGAIVRPIGPVIIAGIVVFAIFYMLLKDNKFHWSALGKLAIVLGLYLVLFNGASALVKSSGLSEYGLSNRDSEWKFVIGLSHRNYGQYDQGLVNQFNLKDSRAKMSKQEHQVIKQNITDLNKNNQWADLLWQKNAIMWAKESNAISFTGINVNHSAYTIKWMTYAGYVASIILIIFSFIGSLRLFKFNFNNGIFLLLLPFMAYVIVQLLIEVQGRYRIEFIPILSILGGVGLFTICNWIKSKWSGRNDRSV